MSRPIRLSIVDDYEVIVTGVRHMLEPFADRVDVVDVETGSAPATDVDVVLFDTFAQGEAHASDLLELLEQRGEWAVAVYTWNFEPALVAAARERGASGYLSKGLPAHRLVECIERIVQGDFVLDSSGSRQLGHPQRIYPGESAGLTEREAEVIALIAQGLDNRQISRLLFLSEAGTKTRIRSAYRKLEVTSRSQAVRWALTHGFSADAGDRAQPLPDDAPTIR